MHLIQVGVASRTLTTPPLASQVTQPSHVTCGATTPRQSLVYTVVGEMLSRLGSSLLHSIKHAKWEGVRIYRATSLPFSTVDRHYNQDLPINSYKNLQKLIKILLVCNCRFMSYLLVVFSAPYCLTLAWPPLSWMLTNTFCLWVDLMEPFPKSTYTRTWVDCVISV